MSSTSKDLSTAKKRALLKQMLKKAPRKENTYPLSFAQQRLWVLDRLIPGDPSYNLSIKVCLQGSCNTAILQKSLSTIVQRHEMLRTTFVIVDGEPAQLIASASNIRFHLVSLEGMHEQERFAQQLIYEESCRPFDLSKGPLVRSTLLRLRAEEHILLLTMHHIVSDGWSSDVLMQELTALYPALLNGQPSPLAPLPIQYVDFATWQRETLQQSRMQQHLDDWKRSLGTDLPTLALSTDHARPPQLSHQGARAAFELSAELTQALKQLSQQEGATLFMTLLAAFQVLLARYSGQADIVVGTPIAGRSRSELERLIGFFVNTLVLRTNLSGKPSFRQVLRRVKEVAVAAYDRQEVPFELLVQALRPQRELNRHPLFQVMFQLHPSEPQEWEGAGLRMQWEEVSNGTAMFDLTLEMQERAGGLYGEMEYSTELFEPETISRMLSHLHTLFVGIAANPDQLIACLPLLNEQAWQEQVVNWNRTQRDYPRHMGVHQLIEEQVECTPDAIALVFEEQQVSYQALNVSANRLAHLLKGQGMQAQELVGICLERSVEMVVALLAVFKAGGAYLPLDPAYPAERLAFMIADSHPHILLTQERLLHHIPASQAKLLCIDRDWKRIVAQKVANPPYDGNGDSLAYVIYTSGSTGIPKGVMVAHHGLVNVYLSWEQAYALRSATAHHLQLASFSFDVFAGDVLRALCSGGKLVLCPQDMVLYAEKLYRLMEREQIDCVDIVPAVLRSLIHYARETEQRLDFLRVLVVGSDSWSASEYLQVRNFCGPDIRLINAYGVTEATIDSTSYEEESEGALALDGPLSIGRPIANTRVYILDAQFQPVPIGVAGELYIGGVGLAHGYLHRPELTSQRFVPDPFSQEPGARLYRTGDLASYQPDGTIQFLGRADQQIKIRGYRIEPGEIEATLQQHPLVRQAVVLARERASGDRRLVAYLVTEAAHALSGESLRNWLKERLPEYMLPGQWVLLEALPLTPNGKIDKAALLAMASSDEQEEREYVAPRTEVEAQLAQIWAQLLGMEQVSVEANFFDLGGHSLLAAQVIARIQAVFQVELPLSSLFDTSGIAALAERIERELVMQGRRLQPIQPVPRVERLPLSFAQQRLWFIYQWETETPQYNTFTAVRLIGTLDRAALERSLTEIVARHETLRTTFIEEQGQPFQVISPPWIMHLPVTRLGHLPEGQRDEQARLLARQEVSRPFNLIAGPLFRAHLLQLGEQEHVLILNMHHIISDGWSLEVLMQELTALYSALLNGQPSPLAPLPIQYVDFATWQRETLQQSRMQQHLDDWKRSLGTDLPTLALPTDHARPPQLSHQGARAAFELSAELTQALKQLSQQEGATLFMTLLAAFQVLLARYSGQADIVVGTPIAGRPRPELERLIGFFVNTLVLRTNLSGKPSFRQVLRRVKEVAVAAYDRQEVPFELLVQALRPQRELNRHPLFQVMFQLQPSGLQEWEMVGLRMQWEEISNGTATFDLTLEMQERAGSLYGEMEYSTELFEPETISRMLSHLHTLFAGIAANPDQLIVCLPLLNEQAWQEQVVNWNRTQRDYPQHMGVHQLIEEQVECTPDAIALVYEEQQVSYQALNVSANRLAHLLKGQGMQAQELVGICLERSVEMVVALLAVFKAGGAYLPLDPAYPAERLAFMITNSQSRLLLTQSQLCQHLPLASEVRQMYLDQAWLQLRQQVSENLGETIEPEQLAYVLYTSGSTGQPKGVQIPQRALVNFLSSMRLMPGIKQQDILLAVTTLSFDIAGLELYLPLLVGARLSLISREVAADGEALSVALREQDATVMQATPATWRLLISAGWPGKADLRVLCGGEALPRDLVAWLLPHVNSLYNMYGPTETTIWSTLCPITSAQAEISIGRPIANTQIYILNSQFQPVPIGVAGELYIGGTGLARGYLHRPELTSQRFVPDPFSQEPGARLYHTGDLASYQPDGTIRFLGRADQQVKIRGYRIEPGEIEARLQQHPLVRQAVVLAREQAGGDQRLVAYLVTEAAHALSSELLRNWLKERLPEYMLPGQWVLLDALPLTPNGKIDRATLLAMAGSGEQDEREYVAPRTEVEAQLAQIWAQLLGMERISVEANFFDLGGHSLLATRVVSRIRELFQIKLSLQELFAAPTVAELARHVENVLRPGNKTTLPPLLPTAEKTAIPLSFAQRSFWLHNQLDPETSAYNLPYTFRLNGVVSLTALERSLQEIVHRHEILRTTFAVVDDQPVQLIKPAQDMLLLHVDLQTVSKKEQNVEIVRLLSAGSEKVFDLSQGPLFRAALFSLNAQEHVLLLTIHHIVFDDWSLEVLLRELSILYGAFAQGEPPPLPDLPVQYRDFTRWQRQWLQGALLESELSYWKQQLEGMSALLELPTDRPRPATQTYNGASVSLTLPLHLCKTLQVLGQQEGATLFMTLLATYKMLLAFYSGQQDIVVGAAIAGRNQRETEDLIGCFINTLVLRTDLSTCLTFREVLRRVREVCLGAYAHPDVPFDSLVDALQPKRNLSHNPLFQVSFALATPSQQSAHLSGVTMQMMDVASEVVQLDLQMWLVQTAEGIHGTIEYNTDLFDASTVTRMRDHFQTLLERVATLPDQPLTRLSLLTEAERQQILQEWNATTAVPPNHACIHQFFEAQAASTPEAIALVCGPVQLSYDYLNRQANHLARRLQRQGVGPEMLVGLALPRSPQLLMGLLAIFKAGGAYLPLDPHYPAERLHFILQDTAVKLVLTTSTLSREMAGVSTLPITPLLLDRCMEEADQQDQRNPQSTVSSQNLAYVIYTSGSTGRPKGALLAHSGLCNLLLAQRQSFKQTRQNRILQFASLNFDASIFEIVMAWGAGATLHLTGQETLQSGPDLARLLEEEAITTLTIPPSALTALLPEAKRTQLQTLVCAGEACPAELVARWAPGRAMYNAYGPTETTVWATVQPCQANGQAPSIGRPIRNSQLYLLDRRMQPVPVGVPGELYIGGVGLARGYLGRAELSAERFVPHPCSQEPGARLYKTGDMGRYLPSGEIEYLGRNDEQVKLRGYRIELGEINALLSQHSSVYKSVVMVREDTPGNKRLVAYVVPQRHTNAFAPNDLRTFLAERLPNYMVPAIYMALDTLPLSPSGKVDLRALPAPEQGASTLAHDYVAPSTPVEKLLTEIWSNVLKIERVGIHDNFFELGGDSILSIRIINKANEAGLRLLPRHMFQQQTITALAALVSTTSAMSQLSSEQSPVVGDVPLTPIQQWFFEQQQPEPHHWNMAVLLEVGKKLQPDLLKQAIMHLLQHHDALRLRFTQGEEGWRQCIAPPADAKVPLSLIDLSMRPQEEQMAALEATCDTLQGRLQLVDGLLMQVALFDLGQQRPDYLFITVHHLAIDIVSWQILLEDLQTAYQQLERGEPIQLMRKTTSFKQWSQTLQDYARSPQLRQELDYWRDRKRQQTARLPVDYVSAENSEASVGEVVIALNAHETQALLQELPRAYHSQVNEVLLTALALALKEWTGQQQFLVDLEGHGREEIIESIDLSRTVGWFTTLAPICLDLAETPGPAEALKAVKEQIRYAPHNRIGYGVLRYLSPQPEIIESLKALPRAEISFNYTGRSLQEFEEDTLWRLSPIAYGRERSPRGKRRYLIEINSAVSEDKLHIYWTYSEAVYQRSTIKRLAQQYRQALQALIRQSQINKGGGLTPSDFSKARISQKDLNTILAKVKHTNGK